jgi:2-polyprenyl-3-methyl-5-hydroxy-6-metoxy-1,4-benzoquinol methylase
MSESESTRKHFPDWENLYKSQSVETMPWYNERFDSDLESELDQRKIIANGKKFLDLGTGPATQAMWLVKRGFSVIGSDAGGTIVRLLRSVILITASPRTAIIADAATVFGFDDIHS